MGANLEVVRLSGSLGAEVRGISLGDVGASEAKQIEALLMEHLASHGYVVVSVSHPLYSLRVDVPARGARIIDFGRSFAGMPQQDGESLRASLATASSRAERAAIGLDGIEHGTDRIEGRHIGLIGTTLATLSANLFQRFLCSIGAGRGVDRHPGAGFGETLANRTADAAGPSRHQGHTPAEFILSHRSLLLLSVRGPALLAKQSR